MAPRAMVAHGAVGSIRHRQKGRVLLQAKFQHAHNIGMLQSCNRPCLPPELAELFVRQLRIEDLDRGPRPNIDMFAKIDMREAATTQKSSQKIIAKALAHTIRKTCH